MKKLLSIFAAFAFIITAFVTLNTTMASAVSGKAAADTKDCKVTAIGKYLEIDKSTSTFKTVGDSVQVKFKVEGKSDCRKTVTFVAWNAPNGTDGKPYSAQTVFDKKTATYKPGTYTMTVKKPLCYYQIDFVRGSSHLGQTGGAHNYNYKDIDLMIAYVHGGKKCEKIVKVCNPATGQIISVKESEASKYKPVGDVACKDIKVCDIKSGKIITIKGYQFNANKHSKNLNDAACKPAPNKINVCVIASGEVIEIDENKFNANTQTKDLTKCEVPETPGKGGAETPEELPSTGPAEALSALFGTGALAGMTTAYIRSRRALK